MFGSMEIEFVINLAVALVCGVMIGLERELRGKPAGLSTQTLVISGAMLFAFLSHSIGAADTARIAAQIVSGVGFLGAGIILKSDKKGTVTNLTTAASIWFAASIGMAIGFNFHTIAVIAALFTVVVNRIPHFREYNDD
jgi:putative Mg2+ transporter-C (MgtC) family protein